MLILKVFYSMQDTKTPMIVAGIIIAFNIAIDFALFYTFKSDVMKVSGLALGNTAAHFVGAVLVWEVLRRRLGSLDGARITRSLAKICVASAATGFVCYVVAKLIGSWLGVTDFWAQLLQVVLAILAGAGVYIGLTLLFKSEEMNALRRLMSRFFSRQQSELEPHGVEPVEEDSIIE
jgi:putative peptidoglycan lipid II flippase